MHTSIHILLTPEEKVAMERRERLQTAPHRQVIRARVILAVAALGNLSAVARQVGVARRIVYKWTKRFLKHRLAGLDDLPRSGRPARFPPDRGYALGEVGLRAS